MGSFFGLFKDKEEKKDKKKQGEEEKKQEKKEPSEQRKKIMDIDLKLKHYRDKLKNQLKEMEKRLISKDKEA